MRGTRISEGTISKIREEARAGATFQEISKKHGISWGTVQYHVDKNGKKPAGGAKAARVKARSHCNGHARAENGNQHFSIELSLVGMDAIWNSLQPEKKAELLKGL